MHRVQPFTFAAGLAAAFMVASAGLHAQAPQSPSSNASKTSTAAMQPSSDDTMFVQKAAEAGKMEVEHGKMAATKASNAQVKAYAAKLVRDHTAANSQLMTIAKRKNISVPDQLRGGYGNHGSIGAKNDATTDTKTGMGRPAGGNPTGTTGASGTVASTGEARDRAGHNEPWMSQTGAAFDKAYIDDQVKAHQDAIALFEKEASGGSDAELKAFAAKQLPGLRGHLKQAQDLQSKLGASTH
jgi:putative membrane protein